jgi:hypothetical protein
MKLYRVLAYAHNDAPKSEKLATTVEGIHKLVTQMVLDYDSDFREVTNIQLDENLEDYSDIHFEYYDNCLDKWYKTVDSKNRHGLQPFILQVFDTID